LARVYHVLSLNRVTDAIHFDRKLVRVIPVIFKTKSIIEHQIPISKTSIAVENLITGLQSASIFVHHNEMSILFSFFGKPFELIFLLDQVLIFIKVLMFFHYELIIRDPCLFVTFLLVDPFGLFFNQVFKTVSTNFFRALVLHILCQSDPHICLIGLL
jgi:hypothetical protein